MKRLSVCVILVMVLTHDGPASAQVRVEYSGAAEQQFREAVELYDAGAYRDAALAFDRLIREYPAGHRITGALVMKGKALAFAGENLEAAKTMKFLIARYPASAYLPDAELTLGLVYGRIDRHEEALEMLLSAYRRLMPGGPERLAREVWTALQGTVDAHIPEANLLTILGRSTSAIERSYLWLKLAEKAAAAENSVAAGIALDSLILRYPSHPYRERVAELLSRIAARGSVKLGVLLPLMKTSDPSAARDIANEIYDGILYAAEIYGKDPGLRVAVTLETRDTERDPRLAARGAQDLADDKDIIGIVGPVFSTSVTAAAAIANIRGVPLITPTANANGLASTGKYIFQANPDYDTRGRAMARYAVHKRGFRTFAVLAPIDAYGKYLADAFIREASRLGARILATEWYQRGTSDLKQQLTKIRRAGMLAGADAKLSFGGRMRSGTLMKFVDLGIPLKRLDSLMAKGSVISARMLFGPRARRLLDSMEIPVVYDESQIDSLEYPVDAIEAVYAPISGPEEIGIVSSQIVYFNFQTQILGSGEWNSFAELNANRRYCEGLEFESDTFVDTTGGTYGAFARGFVSRFRKGPSKNTLFGYDTAMMVLETIRSGATTREALQRALAEVRGYRGFRSRIGLASERVNSWLNVLQYAKDEIRKVDEVSGERSMEGGGVEERPSK